MQHTHILLKEKKKKSIVVFQMGVSSHLISISLCIGWRTIRSNVISMWHSWWNAQLAEIRALVHSKPSKLQFHTFFFADLMWHYSAGLNANWINYTQSLRGGVGGGAFRFYKKHNFCLFKILLLITTDRRADRPPRYHPHSTRTCGLLIAC